ncbi:Non-heme dioxygenase N-terminal domain-containing protein [Cynara cardunculus var. scolymus]|uniref:Non-heme dioxygenase N-terminal domain-containing protein n=1 Tax=Cynara cardunculus var. scolymus TaxID=59895 RepID=A0A124SDA9_CYNCS|nr:Non-heme dioxygenase N-terminal domain-containing protein [Cynara cardunculus var. scolymus]
MASNVPIESNYDRESELKAFDDSKSGVKGFVDAGLTKIPRFFHHPRSIINEPKSSTLQTQVDIPIIDLKETNVRAKIVENVRYAAENWGFFQIINHGIPQRVLDEMIDGARGFHEMETEEKIKYYSRDYQKKFSYTSNFRLFTSDAATWSDTFMSVMAPQPPQPEELPPICRNIITEYSDQIMKLGFTLLELLSEALGLKPDHLKSLGCGQGLFILGHYYPPCPEPELTFGANYHTDSGFLTIVLQDSLGGLQVLHQKQWVNVSPLPGALVLITNNKFKSVHHRVLAQKRIPRISVAAFLRPFHEGIEPVVYRPIKELVSEENPCVYKDTSLDEFVRVQKNAEGTSGLAPFKLDP